MSRCKEFRNLLWQPTHGVLGTHRSFSKPPCGWAAGLQALEMKVYNYQTPRLCSSTGTVKESKLSHTGRMVKHSLLGREAEKNMKRKWNRKDKPALVLAPLTKGLSNLITWNAVTERKDRSHQK